MLKVSNGGKKRAENLWSCRSFWSKAVAGLLQKFVMKKKGSGGNKEHYLRFLEE